MLLFVASVVLHLSLGPGGGRARAAPVVFEHATVFTGATDHPDASWFVVRDGRIADVGAGDLPERWRAARAVDLGGRFVAPGFVDAHVHFVDGGLSLLQIDVSDARGEDALAAAVEQAAAAPLGGPDGWVVVRNLGLDVLDGDPPTHARMARYAALAGARPLLVLLKGGHHAYASPVALARLDLDRDSVDPPFGTLGRGADGELTGLLVDEAAWNAMRAVGSALAPETIARTLLAAQDVALRYGLTTVADNTFYPSHMAQYVRMAAGGALKLRVSCRSYGLEPATRFTMRAQGSGLFGKQNPQVRYFGDKYFVDGALSNAGAQGELAPSEEIPRYTVAELRDMMLFAGPFGSAFHTQSRAGAERLAAARAPIVARRSGALPDVLDHCGRCGGGGLPERLLNAGLKVTVLPGQLHDLPHILATTAAKQGEKVLALRELFRVGLEPAITSDWPYGAEVSYPDVPDGLTRLGLAPLASVAVAVSGAGPDGRPIPGAETRTVTMGQALLGVTAWGAAALGRADVGRIAPGTMADFVVLPRSPFEVDPVALYRLDPDEVWIGGERVRPADPGAPPPGLEGYASTPRGDALTPIIGYDPVTGLVVGGAWFFYPYEPRGIRGSLQLYGSPEQLRARAEFELIAMRAFGEVSPRLWLRADSLEDRYFGRGMGTDADDFVTTKPLALDASLGVGIGVAPHLDVGVHALVGARDDDAAGAIAAQAPGTAGAVNGVSAGLRLELVHDDRDNAFATRFGGRRMLWTEAWGVEAGDAAYRQRTGVTLSQFVPLWAPDVVLALRAEAAFSVGRRAYATDFALGGGELLRGYVSNRFRGDHYVAGTVEVRAPLVWALSAAAFGEVGRVWASGASGGPAVAVSGGAGLRVGLPPDRLVRLRFDVAFAPDQWGLFFKFNEAF